MSEDKKALAKAKLMEQMKQKYGKKINKENDAKRKEEKWVKSITGGEVSPVPSPRDEGKVMVEVDSRTRVLVDKSKCEFVDGKWQKKK